MPDSNKMTFEEFSHQVHDLVDLSLMEAIRDALVSKGQLKTNVVCATLAYMLADGISQHIDSHDHICMLAEGYAHYIHSAAHGMKKADEGEGESRH